MLLFKACRPCFNFVPCRFIENLPKNIRLEVDPTVNEQIKSDNRKLSYFKQHKGKFNMKSELPRKLEEIINSIISDIEPQRLKQDIKKLEDYLAERHLPIEKKELEHIARNVIENVFKNEPPTDTISMSPEQRREIQIGRKTELIKRLKSGIYHWQPLNLDEYRSKIYLATNFASHFAMLVQIFHEIKQRDQNFQPVRLFDFGSGTGSVMWAALHVWGKKAFAEILNVDKSRDMNSLSQLILQGGQQNKPPLIPGVIYRQFMPHGRQSTFDLVVSDHTLFEFENSFERLKTLRSLWYTVKPGGYLVLVEHGNVHGYSAIMEARENLLKRIAIVKENLQNTETEAEMTNDESASDNKHFVAHIFSPCSHDDVCPKKTLGIPCRIGTRYRPLHIYDTQTNVPSFSTAQKSYIVVKKEERDSNDIYSKWPRVIEPILDRKRHQHVRLCCPNGQYVNVPISKNKHGKALHRLSHHAEPGDLFPVTGEIVVEEKTTVDEKSTNQQVIQSRRRAFRR